MAAASSRACQVFGLTTFRGSLVPSRITLWTRLRMRIIYVHVCEHLNSAMAAQAAHDRDIPEPDEPLQNFKFLKRSLGRRRQHCAASSPLSKPTRINLTAAITS